MMSRQLVHHSAIRECLVKARFGGVKIAQGEVAAAFAIACSTPPHRGPSPAGGPADWAYALYAPTASPRDQGGIPEYATNEIDLVLDALVEQEVIPSRALYCDALNPHNTAAGREGTPARVARILHAQCAPVILVAPARIDAYSRYSIPPSWHPHTHEGVSVMESCLRSCRSCGRMMPAEFDMGVLNIAAVTAWIGFVSGCAHGNRGLFVDHASYDRWEYTTRYLATLLRVACSIQINQTILNRSHTFSPVSLFSPCDNCFDLMQKDLNRLRLSMRLNDIEETLALLLLVGNRLTPARRLSNPKNGVDVERPMLWKLGECLENALSYVPGEDFLRGLSREERLDVFSGRSKTQFITAAGDMASTFLRGWCGLASINEDNTGDHWLAALLVTNPTGALQAFQNSVRPNGSVSVGLLTSKLTKLLQYCGPAFGEMWPAASPALVIPNRPFRARKCMGFCGELCLLNEHSGIIPPGGVRRFFDRLGVNKHERASIAHGHLQLFASFIDTAYYCAYVRLDVQVPLKRCCFCEPLRRLASDTRRLVLLASTDMSSIAAAPTPAPPPRTPSPRRETKPQRMADVLAAETSGDDDPPAVDIKLDEPLSEMRTGDADSSLYEESLEADEHEDLDDIIVDSYRDPMVTDADTSSAAVTLPHTIRNTPLSPVHIRGSADAPVKTNWNNSASNHADWEPFSLLAQTASQTPISGLAAQLSSVVNARDAPSMTASDSDSGAVNGDSDIDDINDYLPGIREQGGFPISDVLSPAVPPPPPAPTIRYWVLDAKEWGHLIMSGRDRMLERQFQYRCVECGGRFMHICVPDANGALEVQLDQKIKPDIARKRLVTGVVAAHDIFRL